MVLSVCLNVQIRQFRQAANLMVQMVGMEEVKDLYSVKRRRIWRIFIRSSKGSTEVQGANRIYLAKRARIF